MSKPICVIHLPLNLGEDGRLSTWEDCRNIMEQENREKPDYHWFVFLDSDATNIELEVFYEKDFTEIKYEELKKIITDSIEKQKQ